jgi:hypothetical protein
MLGLMRRPVLLALLISLALAGCGGSSSTSTRTSATTSPNGSGVAATSSAASTSTAPTTSATSASTTSGADSSTSSTTAATDTNVRLPAKFAIQAGGILFPPVVAAPKHTTIDLTVRSQDGKRHTVVLRTPHAYTLVVVPGRASQLALKGLPNGAYAVKVDGAVRGRLIVGATPGP